MKLCHFELDGRVGLAVEKNNCRVEVDGFSSLDEALQSEGGIAALRQHIREGGLKGTVAGEAKWRTPILKPGKILAVVQNYHKHAAEFGNDAPSEPVWFSKLNTSMTSHESNIRIPEWVDGRVDHEVELAVIIGSTASNVTEPDALNHVAGYSILNDVSARRIQKQDRDNRHPWLRCKNFDTFTPFGAWMVTPDEVRDPQNLEIRCLVNNEVRQESNTSNMIHSVAKIISVVSRYTTLEPGDVIATGTPEGVGNLRDGDRVVCEVGKIGMLQNDVQRPNPETA